MSSKIDKVQSFVPLIVPFTAVSASEADDALCRNE